MARTHKSITISFPPDLVKKMDKLLDAEGLNRSAYIQQLIRDDLRLRGLLPDQPSTEFPPFKFRSMNDEDRTTPYPNLLERMKTLEERLDQIVSYLAEEKRAKTDYAEIPLPKNLKVAENHETEKR